MQQSRLRRRKQWNKANGGASTKKALSDHLLPGEDDRVRQAVDRAVHETRQAAARVAILVAEAREHPNQVQRTHALGADLEALVKPGPNDHELYLLIRVVGSAPAGDPHAAILSLAVGGLEAADWMPLEVSDVPDSMNGSSGGEVVWWTLLAVPSLGI